ncbi:MAG: hypothetical protein ABH816_00500 [Candidatus Levyibacteriota bacterium]
MAKCEKEGPKIPDTTVSFNKIWELGGEYPVVSFPTKDYEIVLIRYSWGNHATPDERRMVICLTKHGAKGTMIFRMSPVELDVVDLKPPVNTTNEGNFLQVQQFLSNQFELGARETV